MLVEVNKECMQTNFGECGLLVLKICFFFAFKNGQIFLLDFALFVCLHKLPEFPFGPWIIVHEIQEIK